MNHSRSTVWIDDRPVVVCGCGETFTGLSMHKARMAHHVHAQGRRVVIGPETAAKRPVSFEDIPLHKMAAARASTPG